MPLRLPLAALGLSLGVACSNAASPNGAWSSTGDAQATVNCTETFGFVDNALATTIDLELSYSDGDGYDDDDSYDVWLRLNAEGEIDHSFARPYDAWGQAIFEGHAIREYRGLLDPDVLLEFEMDEAPSVAAGDQMRLRSMDGEMKADSMLLGVSYKICMDERPCTDWLGCVFELTPTME